MFADAQVALQDLIDSLGKPDKFQAGDEEDTDAENGVGPPKHPTTDVNITDENLEGEWSNLSPRAVAEKMIVSNSLPLEHRDGGKRARPRQTSTRFERLDGQKPYFRNPYRREHRFVQ